MKQTDIMFRTMVVTIIAIAMIGMTGFAAATPSSLVLENKNATWQPITDGISAVVTYDSAGNNFVWSATGTAKLVNTSYSLIYYADEPNRFVNWGGDNPGALIGTMMTDGSGVFTASGSINLDMDLPCVPDTNGNASETNYTATDGYANANGAKLWIVPSADYTAPAMTAWNPVNYLFETDLIEYFDCDMSTSSLSYPANATIDVGDSFGGSVLVTVEDATNVGSIDLVVTYNASLVTVTGVANGDMNSIIAPITTGQVHIIAYQTSNPGLNGDFTVANLTFTAVGSGGADFNISVTSFLDATPCVRAMPYIANGGEYCACSNGDVNCDGAVNSGDVMYLAKHLVSITGFENISDCASDVDGSGGIDSNDVMYLAKYLSGNPAYSTLL